MKRNAALTAVGGGALAASVLLAILLLGANPPAVSAAAILTDLRSALDNAILIHLSNVELDYADLAARVPDSQLQRGTVIYNGRVLIPNRPKQEALWELDDVRFRDLSASPNGTGGFSARAKLTACLRDERPWFYLQMDDAPGVAPADLGLQVAILEALRGGLYVTLPSLEFETDDNGVKRQMRVISPDFAQLRDVQRVLGRLEEIATDITVVETEPGLYVLTARGFTDGVALPIPDDSAVSRSTREGIEGWLRDMMTSQTVEVGYRENQGVRWISVRHFGTPDGRIDIQVADVDFDERCFDLDYQLEQRPAPVVDASALLRLVDVFDLQPDRGP